MSETTTEQPEFDLHETRPLCIIYTFTDSIKILFRNPKLFICISIFIIFPLSLLILSLALYSHPLQDQIHHLQAIAQFSTTRFEAGHILKQVRVDSVTLLWIKALFWIPCYVLSLLAMISAVNSTALSCAGKRPNLQTAVTAVRLTWKRSLVTSICVFVIMVVYVHLTNAVMDCVGWNARAKWLTVVLGVVLEVELMAVLSFAMVVSVLEELFGWEAMSVGWRLMEGRRLCGWVLAGFLILVSCGIGWGFRVTMDDQEETMVVMMGLIGLFGLIVLWSYVVYTVFYCECRSRITKHAKGVDYGSSSL
ncbi:hypothetical protein NE237_025411 [Protea cynaroides]|uniref:Transmembrane protein n=1 Tax=Protea cynaroides TaxID=273540 RepID=A0A9Q0H563_9MAGN|nr:hypothetical protein NE237_025411 [Protea cynaroides]